MSITCVFVDNKCRIHAKLDCKLSLFLVSYTINLTNVEFNHVLPGLFERQNHHGNIGLKQLGASFGKGE